MTRFNYEICFQFIILIILSTNIRCLHLEHPSNYELGVLPSNFQELIQNHLLFNISKPVNKRIPKNLFIAFIQVPPELPNHLSKMVNKSRDNGWSKLL